MKVQDAEKRRVYKDIVISYSSRYAALIEALGVIRGAAERYNGEVLRYRSLQAYTKCNLPKCVNQRLVQENKAYRELVNIEDSLTQLPDYTKEEEIDIDAVGDWYNYDDYREVEVFMCECILCDIDSVEFTITKEYDSNRGNISCRYSLTYNFNDFVGVLRGVIIQLYGKSETRKRGVSLAQRQRILRRDNFICQLCGVHGAGSRPIAGTAILHVDHKLPFSKGGTDADSNLWTLCEDCNEGKSNYYDDSDM